MVVVEETPQCVRRENVSSMHACPSSIPIVFAIGLRRAPVPWPLQEICVAKTVLRHDPLTGGWARLSRSFAAVLHDQEHRGTAVVEESVCKTHKFAYKSAGNIGCALSNSFFLFFFATYLQFETRQHENMSGYAVITLKSLSGSQVHPQHINASPLVCTKLSSLLGEKENSKKKKESKEH